MSAQATQIKVKERPILFSGPMVRAILEGRKTQTRRVIKPQPSEGWMNNPNTNWAQYYKRQWEGLKKYLWIMHPTKHTEIVCPYGAPGERFWVRETFCDLRGGGFGKPFGYRAESLNVNGAENADALKARTDYGYVWKPSIFMPRVASRITLEITNVRVERLQEISGADAKAEGMEPFLGKDATAYRARFQMGWDTINGKRKGCTWANNPWVWVIEFKEANEH